MPNERHRVTPRELAGWLVAAALVLVGVGLALALGPRAEPVARPPALEAGR
ncbi:MAG TPA: hypothetical protein VFU46_13020 [Gemmatimonadales bacterium]|nr:hypothetical protein [Gemmatimonadales bacterium]